MGRAISAKGGIPEGLVGRVILAPRPRQSDSLAPLPLGSDPGIVGRDKQRRLILCPAQIHRWGMLSISLAVPHPQALHHDEDVCDELDFSAEITICHVSGRSGRSSFVLEALLRKLEITRSILRGVCLMTRQCVRLTGKDKHRTMPCAALDPRWMRNYKHHPS